MTSSQFGDTRLLLVHARSAFRDEGIVVENNMPFSDGESMFIFNGELRGVRIQSEGRIGAEKIYNYIRRFDKGDLVRRHDKAVDIINKRSSYVRAMNIILSDGEQSCLSSSYSEDPEYFQMYRKQDADIDWYAHGLSMAKRTGRPSTTHTTSTTHYDADKNRRRRADQPRSHHRRPRDLEQPFIIVHGANVLRDQLAERLGMEKTVLTSVSGYSSVFSDQAALDVIMMSYSGLRNKQIVELCQRNGINAVGLTGLDGRLVQGERNKGIRVRENGKTLIKRDLSGKPRQINTALLTLLLDNGYCPVLTIPIVDENGFAINSENDDIVAQLAQALDIDSVVQLIEAPGFLDDPTDESSLVAK